MQTVMKMSSSCTWVVFHDLIKLFVHDTVKLESKITFPFLTFDFLHYLDKDPSQTTVHFIKGGGSYMTLVNSLPHQSDTKL